jgi:hypothetical protein
MAEFSEKRADMSAAALLSEASRLIRLVSEPRPAGDSVKAAQARCLRRLRSWSANRVKDVWSGDRRIRVRADEVDQLRALTAKRQTDKAALADLQAIKQRIERLERLLVATDPAMHSPSLAAARGQHREVVRALGLRHRSEPEGAR